MLAVDATRDIKLRKFNYPINYRYGLHFQIFRKTSHVVLLILLAGDVAINPGPSFHPPTKNLGQGLNALYLNARSLKAFVPSDQDLSKVCKITLLQHLVYSATYDVVCICETWLNESVLSSELLPGYSIFRRDRVGKIGGGVLVAVKLNLHATRRLDLENENIELVVIELAIENSKTALLYTFYRPPDSGPDVFQHLNLSLQNTSESTCIVLIGDFNLPAIDWSLDQPTPATNGGQLEESFCDLVGDNFFQQFIKGTTHTGGNMLDLLLCNCPEIVKNISTFSPEQLNFPTDHHIIEFQIQQTFCRAKPVSRNVFAFNRGNFDDLRSNLIQEPFQAVFTNNINECWIQWKNWFFNAVHKFIPTKTVKDTYSAPWIDGEVRLYIRKKYVALKKYRQCRTDHRKRKLRETKPNNKISSEKKTSLLPR
jgi:hypothetical protein